MRDKYSFLSFDVKDNTDAVDGHVSFNVYNPHERDATMQIGANASQDLTVTMTDMRAHYLNVSSNDVGEVTTDNGLTAYYTDTTDVAFREDLNWSEHALDISTHEKANANLKVIDEAIDRVSSQRSQLGSYQNRLGHTINNLTETSDNLAEAESRIRDVNMAKEMMEFIKNNILSQASQAMLAQANQRAEGVLQLLS